MFEAVIAVCLTMETGPCRDQLIPGYEAATEAACLDTLTKRPPATPDIPTRGAPFCQPLGEALDFVEVTPGVFVHEGLIEEPNTTNGGDASNIGFIIGGATIAVIDSGTARWMGEATWRAIRAQSDKPVSHVILTHMHPDHVFGASALTEAGALTLAHANLPRALADRQNNYIESLSRLIGLDQFLGTQAPGVDIEVVEEAVVDLGARRLHLRVWPLAHTGTDLTVLDEVSGTLFAGDLLFDRHTPALDGSLLGWQKVLAAMAEIDATHVVPGHGGPWLDWPSGAEDQLRYLGVLTKDTREAIENGTRLADAVETIAAEEAEKWLLFDAYNARNATVAFTELEWE